MIQATTSDHTTRAALFEVLTDAQRVGAIGPGRIADHVAHAIAFVEAAGADVSPTVRILDLGSGGGLPGLVIAWRMASAQITLLDGRTERARRLGAAVEHLGWEDRVEVVAERAEIEGHGRRRGTYDLVVARGFGRPAVTAECAAAFLRIGGLLVVSDPPDEAVQTARWDASGCRALGLEHVASPRLPWAFTVLRLVETCSDRYPRRVGIPAKRPLF